MADGSAPVSIKVEVIESPAAVPRGARGRLDPDAEYISGRDGAGLRVLRGVADFSSIELAEGIADIARAVQEAMRKAAPDTWSVELNLGFKAGIKVPVLVSGETNASLKVALGWKAASSAPPRAE